MVRLAFEPARFVREWLIGRGESIVRRIVGYRRFEELDLNQYGRVIGRV